MESKHCPRCNKDLPRSAFHSRSASRDGLQNRCIECMAIGKIVAHAKNPEKRKIYESSPDRRSAKAMWTKAYEAKRPDMYMGYSLQRKYGISVEQYKEMLAEQGGVCAMCGKPETSKFRGKTRRLSVDHCHDTGKVRGLLCTICNVVGKPDDVSFLQKRIAYLTQHSTNKPEASHMALMVMNLMESARG